ncbi:MAG: serine/threonine-protein kinase [Anaerolineaceae bacterium]|nr:serine/threonine-protein kinase [Anaerolineaceae bacterium]
MPLQIDSIIQERYRITKILGHGGMGSVYMAIDENIHIPVAIKENLVLTENYSTQFKKEAVILAGLRHPNLPRVSDYFYLPGQGQYLVMDYIDGEDLRERIEREEKLPDKDVIIIGLMICDALMYLHNLSPKVIHRDIKPGNIRITPEGNVILVDFGLVKVFDINQQTATGARAMTPGYSPPEQYGRGPTDERTDIYSLGATLYAALTGMIPEESLNRMSGKEKLTSIKKYRSTISESLDKIIQTALEIDPENRYQTAEEFYMALLAEGNFLISSKNIGLIAPPPSSHSSISIKTGVSQPLIKSYYENDNQKIKKTNRKIWFLSLLLLSLVVVLLFINQNRNLMNFSLIGNPKNQDKEIAQVLEPQNNNPTVEIFSTPNSKVTENPAQNLISTPEQTTFLGGGSGFIAYSSNYQDNVMQIWMMDIEGNNKIKLTNLADGACQPDWSPDGNKIVFISPCKAKKETYEGARLFILDMSSNNEIYPVSIPLDPSGDFDPVWSPDGNEIAFSSFRPGNHPTTKERLLHIYIYNFTTNSFSELTNTRWRDRAPSWSMDGSKISFIRKIADSEIWILDLNSPEPYVFASKSNIDFLYPHWSLNDQLIFFTHQNNSAGSLPYIVGKRIEDAGVNIEFRIPPSGQQSFSPSVDSVISPDGEWFVFESWPDGINHDIYLATINGANLVKLTTESSFDFSPDWQP